MDIFRLLQLLVRLCNIKVAETKARRGFEFCDKDAVVGDEIGRREAPD